MRIPGHGFFVILFTGRSGSSHIVSCLNSHPHAVTYGEMFPGKSFEQQAALMRSMIAGQPLESLTGRALPDRFRHPRTGKGERFDAVGLKTKPGDLADRVWFSAFLREHDFKVVHLSRSNTVKHALSMLGCKILHKEIGLFNAVEPQHVMGGFDVDPEVLLEKCRLAQLAEARLAEYVDSLGLKTHRMTYESLLADESASFRNLLAFLGLECIPLQGKIHKNLNDNLRDAIRNFDEVAARFAGTSFEAQLLETEQWCIPPRQATGVPAPAPQ